MEPLVVKPMLKSYKLEVYFMQFLCTFCFNTIYKKRFVVPFKHISLFVSNYFVHELATDLLVNAVNAKNNGNYKHMSSKNRNVFLIFLSWLFRNDCFKTTILAFICARCKNVLYIE